MRKTAVAGLVAGLVVTGVGVGAGAAWLVSPSPSDSEATVASPSPAAPRNLDEVVAGQGARSTSVLVPDLGVDYPDTCVGAAQAAAGWQMQVMAPGPVMQAAIDRAGDRATAVPVFLEAIATDVLEPGKVDPSVGAVDEQNLKEVVGALRATMTAMGGPEDGWERRNLGATRTEPVAFRLERCDEHSQAEVTVVSLEHLPLEAVEGDEVDVLPLFSRVALASYDGQWRIRAAETSLAGLSDSRTGERSGLAGGFDVAAVDSEEMGAAVDHLVSKGAADREVRGEVADALGRGGHAYLEAEQ